MHQNYQLTLRRLNNIAKIKVINARVLSLQEEIKTLPWGEVWDEYLARQGMVFDAKMFEEVREYEKEVLSKR